MDLKSLRELQFPTKRPCDPSQPQSGISEQVNIPAKYSEKQSGKISQDALGFIHHELSIAVHFGQFGCVFNNFKPADWWTLNMQMSPCPGLPEGQRAPSGSNSLEVGKSEELGSEIVTSIRPRQSESSAGPQIHGNFAFCRSEKLKRLPSCTIAFSFLCVDTIALGATGATPIFVRLEGDYNTLSLHINALVIGILIFLIFSKLLALYRTDTAFEWRRATLRSVTALAATFSVLMIIAAATKTTGTYSRIWFFIWMVTAPAALVLIRTIGLMLVNARLARGACLQSALIISCGTPALSDKELASETDNRVRASGHLKLMNPKAAPDFADIIRDHDPDIIVVDVPWSEVEVASEFLSQLSRYAVEVLLLPQKACPSLQIIGSQRLGRQVFLQTSRIPIGHWSRVYKRAEDLFVAIAALLILWPVLLLIAAAIKLESRGPVIFRQKRFGFNGQLIEVWKFRSMCVEDTDYGATHQTERNDPRVTRFGRLIRRFSLDELPQLYNVLMGQMSIVGPRPHALQTSVAGKALDQIAEEYDLRHRVKPGITGWAQINGSRGELTTVDQLQKRLAYDLYYIENWSLLFDLKIIIKTLATITCDRNAY